MNCSAPTKVAAFPSMPPDALRTFKTDDIEEFM